MEESRLQLAALELLEQVPQGTFDDEVPAQGALVGHLIEASTELDVDLELDLLAFGTLGACHNEPLYTRARSDPLQPWGEFIDTEWYAEGAPIPLLSDPWRQRPLNIVMVPRDILEAIVQPERMRFCDSDHEKLAQVRAELLRDGLREPLELVLDNQGRIILRDGHHRLVVTRAWRHFETLPCIFTRSEQIRVAGFGNLSSLAADLILRGSPA